MIIQPTSLAALTWAGAAAGSSAEVWRIGTVLAARLLGVNDQGLHVLQIGATTVEAEVPGSQLPAQFQVRVLTLGAQPMLEVMTTVSAESTVSRALRERLPQQNGYAPLLATLDALTQWSQLRQLPDYIRSALALLEYSIRTPEEVSQGTGLREAILRSGLFLEAALAAMNGDAAALGDDDWKSALLRLAAALQNQAQASASNNGAEIPPPMQQRGMQAQPRAPLLLETQTDDIDGLLTRLRGEVNAALARLEVTQLEASMLPAWIIEIPLKGKDGHDILQLCIEPTEQDPPASATWTLSFAIDLPPLGPVQGELQLRGLRLSVRLWAQHRTTVEKLERQFTNLRQRLATHGLTLDQLSCQCGLPQPASLRSAVLLKTTA